MARTRNLTNWKAILSVLAFGFASSVVITKAWGPAWAFIWGTIFAIVIPAFLVVLGFLQNLRRERAMEQPMSHMPQSPEQALVIFASITSGGNLGEIGALQSPLLRELTRIRKDLETKVIDESKALAELEQLKQSHPYSPAIHWDRAKILVAQQPEQAAQSASTAISLAISGGMNSTAVRVLVEFYALRDSIEIQQDHASQLQFALTRQGHSQQAKWLVSRIQSPNPPAAVGS